MKDALKEQQERPELGATHEERLPCRKHDEEDCGLVSTGLADGGVCQLMAEREDRADSPREPMRRALEDVTAGTKRKGRRSRAPRWGVCFG